MHTTQIKIDNVTIIANDESLKICIGDGESMTAGGFISMNAAEAHAFALAWQGLTSLHETIHE